MAETIQLIAVVATILGLGVAAQVVSDRVQVPSVMFLILAGIAVGPEGLGVITPTVFGESLSAIVGLSVAIIVFEGAFYLRIDRLREAPQATLRLITVGALIAFVGTAIARHVIQIDRWILAIRQRVRTNGERGLPQVRCPTGPSRTVTV